MMSSLSHIAPIRSLVASCSRHAVQRLVLRPYTLPANHALLVQHRAQTRSMSTPAPQVALSELSETRYHTLSDVTMETLLHALEEIVDAASLGQGFEVEYHSGVLTLSLGTKGTYVINKQPPNKQIWVSSPVSGPKRFSYSATTDSWLDARDGVLSLQSLLETELKEVVGEPQASSVHRIDQVSTLDYPDY